MKKQFTITFDRIGRNHNPGTLLFELREKDVDAEIVAQRIYNYARKSLISTDFDVVVDLTKGTGRIEYGRYGTFTITSYEVPA